jgi:hypothetical protein
MELKLFSIGGAGGDPCLEGEAVVAASDMTAAFRLVDELDHPLWKAYFKGDEDYVFSSGELPGQYEGEPQVLFHRERVR